MPPRRPTAAISRITALLALVGALASFSGCGGTPGAAGAFCEEWVAAYCDGNRDCCTSPDDTYPDVESCKSTERARCALGTGRAFTGSPPLASFNGTEGERALLDLRAAAAVGTCTAPPSLDSYTLVVGTLQVGEDCSPLGGDLSPIAACEPGARCLLAASRTGTLTGQCVSESAGDNSCVAETCAPGYYCAGFGDPSAGSAGICAVPKSDGAECEHARECLTGVCASRMCGTLGGPGISPWCVPGAGVGAVLPPADLGTDLGGDVDAGV